MKKEVIIAPSILAASFLNLEKEILDVEKSGAKYLHFDVMDGQFVNNISFGIPVLKSISKCHNMINDVHLMIVDPLKYFEEFIFAGANSITIHYETINDEIFKQIFDLKNKYNIKLGIALSPKTKKEELMPYLKYVDLVLVMSVEPGFGGQKFIEETFEKIEYFSNLQKDYNYLIEVDGGINALNAKKCVESGANILVAGAYIFNSKNRKEAISILKGEENGI